MLGRDNSVNFRSTVVVIAEPWATGWLAGVGEAVGRVSRERAASQSSSPPSSSHKPLSSSQ